LLAFLHTGTIAGAKKQAGVTGGTWTKWGNDKHFQEMYKRVKTPVVMQTDLANALGYRAMLELYAMLGDEKLSTRQWAIERIASLMQLRAKEKERDPEQDARLLSQAEIKRIASGVVQQLPEAVRERVERSPFEFIDAEHRVLTESGLPDLQPGDEPVSVRADEGP
jgi:hypothetical protein